MLAGAFTVNGPCSVGAGAGSRPPWSTEARARARASGPGDLAILDLGLPDGSGLDLLVELREAGWGRLAVLSAADDAYSVRAAFVAGAQGYLLKSASPVVVAAGVRRLQ